MPLFCCCRSQRNVPIAPINHEAEPNTNCRRIAKNCKKVGQDILIGTCAGALTGATIGGALAYSYWSESHRIHKLLLIGQEAREDLLKEEPSMSFATSLPLIAMASDRNDNYRQALGYLTVVPTICAVGGAFVGCITGLSRVCKSIFLLKED